MLCCAQLSCWTPEKRTCPCQCRRLKTRQRFMCTLYCAQLETTKQMHTSLSVQASAKHERHVFFCICAVHSCRAGPHKEARLPVNAFAFKEQVVFQICHSDSMHGCHAQPTHCLMSCVQAKTGHTYMDIWDAETMSFPRKRHVH